MSRTAHTDDPPPIRLARAARAAEELCATLWEAMREELCREPRAQRVAELSERLAQVCSAVASLAGEEPEPRLGEPAPRLEERPAPPKAPEIEIHDTRRESAAASAGADEGDAARRVEQGGEGSAACVESIEANLERHAVDGLPFAVLLAEVPGVERLAQVEPSAVLAGLLDGVEEAIGSGLRCTDAVGRESPSRWWLTASRTDAAGAHVLAERMARMARSAATHRGVPLELAIGIAVCPTHGGDATALAAHAEVGLYAARATGRPVAPVDDT